jgi:adenosylhomocysteine nucleosidase
MGMQSVPRSIYDILFVVSGEYEPSQEIQRRFAPLRLGSGMVEASIRLVRTLTKMEATTRCPDLVVSLGVAISEKGDTSSILHVDAIVDWQLNRDIEQPSTLKLSSKTLPSFRRNLQTVVGLQTANLSAFQPTDSSNQLSASGVDLVDPEGFAIAKISEAHGIPAIIVRGAVQPGTGKRRHAEFADLHTPFVKVCERVLAAYSQ